MTDGGGVYEYDVDCDTCGRTFALGLSVPAETIAPDDLARIVDVIHAPHCPGPPTP